MHDFLTYYLFSECVGKHGRWMQAGGHTVYTVVGIQHELHISFYDGRGKRTRPEARLVTRSSDKHQTLSHL